MSTIPTMSEIREHLDLTTQSLDALGDALNLISRSLMDESEDRSDPILTGGILRQLLVPRLVLEIHGLMDLTHRIERPETGVFGGDDAIGVGGSSPLEDFPPAAACPFCGSSNLIWISEESDLGEEEPHFRAGCRVCGCKAGGGPTALYAAREWNRRGTLTDPHPASEEATS